MEIHVRAGATFESLEQHWGGNDIALGSSEESHTGKVFSAYSYHADELLEPVAAARRIYSLQVLLNGAIRVCQGRMETVPIIFTDFNGEAGTYAVDAHDLEEEPFSRQAFIDEDLSGFRDPKRHCASLLIYLSKQDEIIRTILLLAGLISTLTSMSRIHSWNSLYKIYETVKFGCGQRKWGMVEFCDTGKINDFTAACNNVSILGINSRHGLKKGTPPTRVISDFGEACGLVLQLAHNFCWKYVRVLKPV
jgi:hypothetical protein